jgi:2-keto-4-pentenoate hydratase
VLGDSAYCVAWLAEKLKGLGSLLKKGDVVLPGALSKMVPIKQGDVVRAKFSNIGHVEVKFI